MIKIKELHIQNFRSYGDYLTSLNFGSMGPVLVVGQVDDNLQRSNGSGKTTLLDAIIWVLFDRLPSKDRPASNVVNWHVGKNCIVKLITTDGYEITRTRKFEGHNDLLIHTPDGEDITDSTNKNAQQHLLKLFNLDYEIFMSSVFFGQFGRPFLELPDPRRKKAMERMLHLTKFDHYAAVAKEKHATMEVEQSKHNGELENIKQNVLDLSQRADNMVTSKEQFESTREERIKTKLNEIPAVIQEHEFKVQTLKDEIIKSKGEQAEIKTYDVIKLKQEWGTFEEALKAIDVDIAGLSVYDKKAQELRERKSEVTILDEITLGEHQQKLLTDAKKMDEIIPNLVEFDLVALHKEWDKYEESKKKQEEIQTKTISISNNITKVRTQIEGIEQEIADWEERVGKCPSCKQEVTKDYTAKKTAELQSKLDELEGKYAELASEKNRLSKEYEIIGVVKPVRTLAEAKLTNEQIIDKRLTRRKIDDDLEELRKKMGNLTEENKKSEELIAKFDQAIKLLGEKKATRERELALKRASFILTKPIATIREAELINEKYRNKTEQIKNLNNRIAELGGIREKDVARITKEAEQLRSELNPYDKLIEDLRMEVDEAKKKRQKAEKRVSQYDTLLKHLEYIRSAYSDRRKIKSYILSRLIPYFNERIKFYLEELDCQYNIEFNAFLQTKSDRWPYELWSGGERKRIDLAVMFAMHDLHKSLYDQRCNLLVFDEVDGKLDPDGVNSFVNLVLRDFDEKSGMDAVLVISHKDEMRDFFPTKIAVKKVNNFSKIEEIR